MTWVTVPTWTTGQVLTAGHLNLIGGNLNETAAGKATTAGGLYVGVGTNQIAERIPQTDFQSAADTTTSSSYTAIANAGPAVTVTSGAQAFVLLSATLANSSASGSCFMGVVVSGASTVAANDGQCLRLTSGVAGNANTSSFGYYQQSLTPGSNTFTAQYKTGGSGTGTFDDRRIVVFPF